MNRRPTRSLGTINTTRESDGAPITVNVYREMVRVNFNEGSELVEGNRVFKVNGTVVRLDGSDHMYLTDGGERYRLSQALG